MTLSRSGLTLPIVGSIAVLIGFLSACGGTGASSSGTPVAQAAAVVSRGTITGFGSVHVNGEHFQTSSTAFSIDGDAGTQNDLRVGHEIEVRGHHDGAGNAFADRIEMHSQVRGPIQSVDLVASTLVVMGQTVIVDGDTSFDDTIAGSTLTGLALADVVRVSGVRRADGAITATRIEKMPATVSLKVNGTVSAIDTVVHKFHVNALVVDYSTATLQGFSTGQPANGDAVEVKGASLNPAGELVARTVEKETHDDGAPGERSELEGLITRFVSATDFDVAGRKVTSNGSTTFQNGVAADLALNVKVEVEGSVDANDVLVASKVEFKRHADAGIAAPIDSINATAGTLVVLGVDITVNALTRVEDKGDQHLPMFNLSNLVVGDFVEVRGAEMPAASNDVAATRIERRRASTEVRLRGVVDTSVSPGFSILGVNVLTNAGTEFGGEDQAGMTATTFFDGLAGKTVTVKGTFSAGVLTAREVEFEDN